jgi:hypothetical protein
MQWTLNPAAGPRRKFPGSESWGSLLTADTAGILAYYLVQDDWQGAMSKWSTGTVERALLIGMLGV